jgi:hypothetical protein
MQSDSSSHTECPLTGDDVLGLLAPEDVLRPIHKPDEIWARCPSCEPTGPRRHRLTITITKSDAVTVSCREGCSPARITALLVNRAPKRTLAQVATEPHAASMPPQTARDRSDPPSDPGRTRSEDPSDSRSPVESDTGISLVRESILLADAVASEPTVDYEKQREIVALGGDLRSVRAALPALRVDSSLVRFPCPMPGHHRGTALLRRRPGGLPFEIACKCQGKPTPWSLAQVRAAHAGRPADHLSRLEEAVWYRRLFFDAALLPPRVVDVPDLHAPTRKQQAALEGFALLLGLRWLTHYGQPVPYGKHFAAAWCDTAASTAQLALNAMKDQGVMVEAGDVNRSKLYLPGGMA